MHSSFRTLKFLTRSRIYIGPTNDIQVEMHKVNKYGVCIPCHKYDIVMKLYIAENLYRKGDMTQVLHALETKMNTKASNFTFRICTNNERGYHFLFMYSVMYVCIVYYFVSLMDRNRNNQAS